MMNDLIEKIAAQTGMPAAQVMPVVGALLSHLSEILPPPLAHMIAVAMGIHEEPGGQPAPEQQQAPEPAGGLGGLLGGLLGGGAQAQGPGQQQGGDPLGALLGGLLGGGAAQGNYAGAGALANVAESLLAGMLSGRR